VAGGVLKPGDEVMHLPSGFTTKISAIEIAGTPVTEAFSPMSVTLLLSDDVDISRGDMICRPNNRPAAAQDIEGMVVWMSADRPLAPRSRLVAKHTTRTVKAIVTDLHYRIDVNTLHRDETAKSLGLNEVGRIKMRLTQPVFADPYARNRLTGGMILIDEATNTTVGTVMITEAH
jgi:bifunctional enzyme CysN/CysC